MRELIIAVTVFTFASTISHAAVKWNNGNSSTTNGSLSVIAQKDPGGPATNYRTDGGIPSEIPEDARPNDATISLYEEGRKEFISVWKSRGNLYTIQPKGNAEQFTHSQNLKSETLQQQLSKGYILSYLFFDDGELKYDGLPASGRFSQDINNETLFYTHSTGKSIISYIAGHAICEGFISSIDEKVDWPLMRETLYHGQPLINLLNMSAGDKHTVDERASRVMGSNNHHRDIDHISIAELLRGTKRKGNELFYNNVLTDIIASYVAFRAGDNHEQLLNRVFQDKIKIESQVHFELHRQTGPKTHADYGQLQTRSSYSFMISRKDLLRVAIAMMKDYQTETCVGKYLKKLQSQAKKWPKYRPNGERSHLWMHNYAKTYGGQFYFDFHKMKGRNIFGTEGYNGQNMLIDMDNSRIVVTQSAATAWDQRTYLLNVIRDGKLPK